MIRISNDYEVLHARMVNNQSTFNPQDRIEFSIIQFSRGNIQLSTGTGQQRGIFTLKTPGHYEIESLNRIGFNTSNASCTIGLHDITNNQTYDRNCSCMPYGRNISTDNNRNMTWYLDITAETQIELRFQGILSSTVNAVLFETNISIERLVR